MSTETEEIRKMTGLQKILAALVLLIAAYAFVGFLVAPHILKWILEKKLSEGLHREVTIGKIYVNPFSLSMDAEDFVMKKQNGDEKVLTFNKLHANLQAMSLFKWGLVLRDVQLDEPYIYIKRNEDESYNFSDLLEHALSKSESESDSKAFRFAVSDIHITKGSIEFHDGPKQTKHEVRDLMISLPFLSDLPDDI
ncbi:MAG: hypothetical protein JSV11_01695, partial [Nitrospiraceae bacterium]